MTNRIVMTFNEFKERCKPRIQALFSLYIKDPPGHTLDEAVQYVFNVPGKAVRPLLVYAVGDALGANWQSLDVPACAIELIHLYSLIHDDLPAMDNADLRRGKPT